MKIILVVFFILTPLIIFSQTISGRVCILGTNDFISGCSVVVEGTKIGVTTDSCGIFKKEINIKDTFDLKIHFIGLSTLRVKNITINSDINFGTLYLVNIPSFMEVGYYGISKAKNRKYDRRDKRNYKKHKRRFKFENVKIIDKEGYSYLMKASNKKYVYEINYTDFKNTTAKSGS